MVVKERESGREVVQDADDDDMALAVSERLAGRSGGGGGGLRFGRKEGKTEWRRWRGVAIWA